MTGLLANDLLAFQLERDRRNFLLAVEDELGAEIETEASEVRLNGRHTTVVSAPIGVDFDRIQRIAADPALKEEQERLVQSFCLRAPIIGIGVDRLDYTKGIPERIAALDAALTQRPELRGRMTFVQIGVPSRSELASYTAIENEISHAIDTVNRRHTVGGGPPAVIYHRSPLTIASLVALYRLAHFCIVSSLHDGMNLVAKEFVASRDDEDGVLVLSALAGAAQELQDALIINPYDVDGFADALIRAIEMPRTRAHRAHARHAARRRRTERVQLGLRRPRRPGKPVVEATPLHCPRRGGCTRLMRRNAAERMILSRRHVPVLAHFAGSNVLVAFDYDGTLAPIVATPAAARMRPSTRHLLTNVAARYPCVVISGRRLDDLAKRLQRVPIWHLLGDHGFESRGTPKGASAQVRGGWPSSAHPGPERPGD